MSEAVELDLPWNYTCEGCFQEVEPALTKHQYERAKDSRGRFLCEACLAKKLTPRAKPVRAETLNGTAGRGGA